MRPHLLTLPLLLLVALFSLAFQRPSVPPDHPPPAGKPAAPAAALPPPVRPAPAETPREALIRTAAAEIGTQEATGKNDGPVVKYLTSTGNSKGEPYCASFVYWCGKTALGTKNPFPKSAWSPDFVSGGTSKIDTARPGDTFGIYFSSKGRVAHTGLIKGKQGKYLVTIEGNTAPSASAGSASDRDGDGVWSKLRSPSTIYRIKSWLP